MHHLTRLILEPTLLSRKMSKNSCKKCNTLTLNEGGGAVAVSRV